MTDPTEKRDRMLQGFAETVLGSIAGAALTSCSLLWLGLVNVVPAGAIIGGIVGAICGFLWGDQVFRWIRAIFDWFYWV